MDYNKKNSDKNTISHIQYKIWVRPYKLIQTYRRSFIFDLHTLTIEGH